MTEVVASADRQTTVDVTPDVGGTATERELPAAPTIRGALRLAGSDFYFNSWRLVPSNLVWGAGLLLLLVLAGTGALLPALALTPLLAFPGLGLFHLAGLIGRGNGASIGEGFAAWRLLWRRAVALGVATTGLGLMFVTNITVGALRQDVIGVAIATAAGWGLLAMLVVSCVLWPLATDPARTNRSLRDLVGLALRLTLAYPVRFLALGLVIAAIVALSTIAFVAILSVSVGLVALVATRFVLPAADRLEARLATREA
jgi:uncharacterized membrane protein YesL